MNRLHLMGPLTLLLASCAENFITSGKGEDAADSGDYGAPEWDGDADVDSDTDADADDGLGSEDENDFVKLMPAATNVYVFVANASRDTVTRVSVPSLQVITAEVGNNPLLVETTDDYRLAVTFNEGSDTVSVIDAESLYVEEVPVRPNLNNMVVSPDGHWAACFHDPAVDEEDTSGSGAQSFSEVSLVNLETRTATTQVVGTNPRQVQYTDDSTLAVVVSDAYLSVIDLTEAEPSPVRIALSDDTVDPPEAEEVVLSPDGRYAFVRQYGVDVLLVVDLVLRTVTEVDVGANPTDLDLTPDGRQAVAVSRGAGQLWIYDVEDPYGTPRVVDLPPDYVFGSVLMSPTDDLGLIYSTATGRSQYAAWNIDDDSISVHGLVKPVASMAITPDGGTALVFHPKTNGEDSDPAYEDHWALTLVSLSDYFAHPLLLPAEPSGFANAEDGQTGYFIMEGQPYLEVLHYGALDYDEIALASDPVFVGVLPESNTAYINQEHDLGRLSFYYPDTEVLQTLTGFELNSGIEY